MLNYDKFLMDRDSEVYYVTVIKFFNLLFTV